MQQIAIQAKVKDSLLNGCRLLELSLIEVEAHDVVRRKRVIVLYNAREFNIQLILSKLQLQDQRESERASERERERERERREREMSNLFECSES